MMKLSWPSAIKKSDTFQKAGWGVALFSLIYLAVKLAGYNSVYPFTLFMDERVTYEPVHNVLHGNLETLLWFIFDGTDHRYGRLLWNSSYLASFIPFHIWGDSGQIVATRVLQIFLLTGGYILIIRSLIRSTWIQLFCLIVLLVLPPSFYYFLMPKPESLIVFMIGLFFYRYSHRSFSDCYFIIGILASLKLSMLPVCLLFAMATFWASEEHLTFSVRRFFKSLSVLINLRNLLICIGWSCLIFFPFDLYLKQYYAETIFLKLANWNGYNLYPVFIAANVLAAGVMVAILVTACYRFKNAYTPFRWVVFMILGFSACSPYLYFTPFNIKMYLKTPVTHPLDRSDIQFDDWMNYAYDFLFQNNMVLAMTVLLAVANGLFLINRNISAQRPSLSSFFSVKMLPLFIFLLTAIPIVCFTHRLWGFYLLLPAVFFFISYAVLSDEVITRYKHAVFFMPLPLLFYIISATPVFYQNTRQVATHENDPAYLASVQEYFRVTEEVNTFTQKHPLDVLFWDPNLFYPDQINHKDVRPFWGPFSSWNEADLVLLPGYPDSLYKNGPESTSYTENMEAIKEYKQHTDSTTGDFVELFPKKYDGYKVFGRIKYR